MTEVYTHPDTGETVAIPDGSYVVRNGDLVQTQLGRVVIEVEDLPKGEIVFWHNPSELQAGERHELADDGYLEDVSVQPGDKKHFARDSVERWVLASVSDEVDVTRLGPRNTVENIAYFLARTVDVPGITPVSRTALQMMAPGLNVDLGNAPTAEEQVHEHIQALVAAELVVARGDGEYEVTDLGRAELAN